MRGAVDDRALVRCGQRIADSRCRHSTPKFSERSVRRLSGSPDPVLAYKAWLVAGRTPGTAEARALQAEIPASASARALMRVFEQDEKTLHHVYRKWQGPHWTLTCLALIDYPPGDEMLRPLVHRVHDWLLSKHFLETPLTAIYPGAGRPGPSLRVDGRQRDLVLRPARAGGRTHSRASRPADWMAVARRRLELRQATRRCHVVVSGVTHPGARAVGLRKTHNHQPVPGRRPAGCRPGARPTTAMAPSATVH